MSRDRLRLVGGTHGGRRLRAAPGSRPTQERVREALFSRWSGLLAGATFLDLCTGSGAVGLEALSRGAERAILVDEDRHRLQVARANAAVLDLADRCVFLQARLPRQWPRVEGSLERRVSLLVFADPPYDFADYPALLERIRGLECLRSAAIEHSTRATWTDTLVEHVFRDYGESRLTFIETETCTQPSSSSGAR